MQNLNDVTAQNLVDWLNTEYRTDFDFEEIKGVLSLTLLNYGKEILRQNEQNE